MKVYRVVKRSSGNKFRETSIKLSDAIQGTDINIKMKGYAFSSLPRLIYKACGLSYKKQKSVSFRSTLNDEELRKVIEIEDKVIEILILNKDYGYNEIKQEILKETG